MSKFDLSTHIRDGKTGAVVRTQPYRLVIDGGNRKFERPVGSGMWYDEGGTLIESPTKATDSFLQASGEATAQKVDEVIAIVETELDKTPKASKKG